MRHDNASLHPQDKVTDPRGRVQSGIVAFIEELLRRDMAEFGLVTIIEPGALAYALVRLGESLLYVDVLAARKPDVAAASRLQQALIEGILPLADSGPFRATLTTPALNRRSLRWSGLHACTANPEGLPPSLLPIA